MARQHICVWSRPLWRSSLLLMLALLGTFSVWYVDVAQEPQSVRMSEPEDVDLIPQFAPRSVEAALEAFATEPTEWQVFHHAAKFETQAYINSTQISNVNAIYSGPWLFASGNMNVTNSVIIFKGAVQFFSTKQYITLDANSKWTFEDTVEIMVFTVWQGAGFIYFPPGSTLTVHSSNTLQASLTTLFEGSVVVADLITMCIIEGPSLNIGSIVVQDRTSMYVCATSTDIGRCVLNGTVVTTGATYLSYWRIVEQLMVWGGIMNVYGGQISCQLSLPFDLTYRATPIYNVLDVYNVSRTVVLCGTLFGTTVTSLTTVIVIDTSCTYAAAPNLSNYATPFVPSDGWIINWGTVIFANVTSRTKALYIVNGVFEILGQGIYIDVETTSTTPFTVALMYYNSSTCILDWTEYEQIVGCPSGAVCRTSGEDQGGSRCVYWFHLNDYNPSDTALWWLLLLLIIPYYCCCWLVWHCWRRYRKYRNDQKRAMRHDADLAYGKDHDAPLVLAMPIAAVAGAACAGDACAASPFRVRRPGKGTRSVEGGGCVAPEGCILNEDEAEDEWAMERAAPTIIRPNTDVQPGTQPAMQAQGPAVKL